MGETAELVMVKTVVVPPGIAVPLPSYPWSPEVVEDMAEDDRKLYLRLLRRTTNALLGRENEDEEG